MNIRRSNHTQPKPSWLKRRLPNEKTYESVCTLLNKSRLHTVCQEAKCPNHWECFSRETATFLIMGPRCTRNCRFCAIEHGPMAPPDPNEPEKIAEAIQTLNLGYVVVTSVTRDDLEDGGAGHFAATIRRIRKAKPGTRVEVLIPDFKGSKKALDTDFDWRVNSGQTSRIFISDINLMTCMHTCMAVAPFMKKQKSGKIVCVSSTGGIAANGGYHPYGTAKAAIIYYSRALAQGLAPFGINVNCIAPGIIRTGRLGDRSGMAKYIPLDREGTIEDCAKVVEFLVTDMSDYVTGNIISIDGGYTDLR
jgi:hypothetical protein